MSGLPFHRSSLFLLALLALGLPAQAQSALSANALARVNSAISFMEARGEAEAANRLRQMLAEGRIVEGQTDSPATMAQAEDGRITVNTTHMTRPRPGNTPAGEVETFSLAMTLVHEAKHIEQGGNYVLMSNINNVFGNNPAEAEGWGAGMSAAVNWLDQMRTEMKDKPPEERQAWAQAVSEAASMTVVFFNENHGYGEFQDFRVRQPNGIPFASEQDFRQWVDGVTQDVRASAAPTPNTERGTTGSGGGAGQGPGVERGTSGAGGGSGTGFTHIGPGGSGGGSGGHSGGGPQGGSSGPACGGPCGP